MVSNRLIVRTVLRLAIVAGALALAAPAGAAEDEPAAVAEASVVAGGSPFTPILNGVLADPLFLPPKGKLYGSGTASITLATSDNFDASGAMAYRRVRHDVGLSHGLAYGLTPRLSLHGSLGYSFNFADDTAPGGAVNKSFGGAISGSGVGLTWRALSQKTAPVVVDASLNYSPTFFLSDPSLRDAVNVNVGVGRAMRSFTLQLIGNATWRPTHHFMSNGGATQIEQHATLDYTVAFRTQFRFSRSFSTDASVNYALAASHLTIDQTNQLSSGEDAPSVLTLSSGLNYQVIRNRLAIGAYYSRQFQSDSGQTSSDPAQSNYTRNAARHVISGKVYYVIN